MHEEKGKPISKRKTSYQQIDKIIASKNFGFAPSLPNFTTPKVAEQRQLPKSNLAVYQKRDDITEVTDNAGTSSRGKFSLNSPTDLKSPIKLPMTLGEINLLKDPKNLFIS